MFLDAPEGLSADFVETLFEDREGDIWVATIDGLDRFRDLSVHTLSVGQGLSNATVESVLAARDGAVWLGTMDGLDRWENGHIDILRKKDGLPDSAIHSLFQDSQDRIWVSTLRGLAILAAWPVRARAFNSGWSAVHHRGPRRDRLGQPKRESLSRQKRKRGRMHSVVEARLS